MMNLTEIASAIVALAAAVVSAVVLPWLKAKLGAEKLRECLRWVDIAVAAAEQLFDAAQGAEKKRYVLDYLAAKGYEIDGDDIENAIESAVLKLHREIEGSVW